MEQRVDIASLLIRLTAEHLTGDAPARRAIQEAYRHLLGRYEAAFAEASAHGDLRADLDPADEASALVAPSTASASSGSSPPGRRRWPTRCAPTWTARWRGSPRRRPAS